MNLLLDTHVLIWMFSDDARLAPAARDLLEDRGNRLFCSDASVWEVALKSFAHPDGNLDGDEFEGYCAASDVLFLPVRRAHFLESAKLPAVHKDPFDRLLIAQAACEGMSLVSHDGRIARYPLPNIIHI